MDGNVTTAGTANATPAEAPAGKTKRGQNRPLHPLVQARDPESFPLSATPEDYDFGRHRPLIASDFKDMPAFLNYKADFFGWRAQQMRNAAKNWSANPDKKTRNAGRRLGAMIDKALEFKNALEKQGLAIDPKILQAIQDLAAATAAKTA